MNATWQEILLSIRSLRKAPAFSTAVILTLALGIGANGTIFTAINSVLLAPLPYPNSHELVDVHNTYPKSGLEYANSSIPDYLDRKEGADALEDLFLYTYENFNLMLDGQPQSMGAYKATASMFSTLQVQPSLGSAFTQSNMQPGADRVVVISYSLWQELFEGQVNAIGQTINLDGEPYEVLGVMPQDFIFPHQSIQLWVPFAFTTEQMSHAERGSEYSRSIGRLKPDASIDQLNAQMDAIVVRVVEEMAANPEFTQSTEGFLEATGFTGRAEYWHDRLTSNLQEKLWLLQAAVVLVLLIACANVSNLQLVRLTKRQRELSLRSALGAGIGRLASQLILESLILAMLGAAAAVVIAIAGIQLIKLAGLELPNSGLNLSLNGSVLLYMLLVAIVAAIVSALIPVILLGRARMQMLREGGRGSTGLGSSKWLQQALVVVQTAMALALLIGSALMLRTFINLSNVDTGFDSDHVMTARIALPVGRYPDAVAQTEFYQRLKFQLQAIPGVEASGIVTPLPFSSSDWTSSYGIEGEVIPTNQAGHNGHVRIVDADYFKAMNIELLQGRLFEVGDVAETTPVVIIDRYFAEQRFPGGNPIGQRITRDGIPDENTTWWTIVGVVENVHHNNLDRPFEQETYYFNYPQAPLEAFNLAVKSIIPQTDLTNQIRAAVQNTDAELPVYNVREMQSLINDVLLRRQAPMLLLAAFAGVALILAAVGIYSVLSFMVVQRRREIGVRMAIGAQAQAVVQMVLQQGGWMLSIGCTIGVLVALVLSRVLATQLFGVSSLDVPSYLLVVGLLGSVGMLACWLPARRAATVQPMEALRYE